jgi:hypothetical protein
MSDELTPEAELASALVDGDVDVAARATALGVEVQRIDALAAEYAAVRAALRDAPVADNERRESAIAAALAAFDDIASGDSAVSGIEQPTLAPVTTLSPVPRPARPGAARWYRVTAAAAAAVLVGVIGTIAFGGLGGSDDDSASVVTEAGGLVPAAREAESAQPAAPSAETAATPDMFTTETMVEDVSAADTNPATETSALPAGGGVSSTIGTIGDTANAPPQIFGPDQLRLLAESLRQKAPAETNVAGCGIEAATILTDATYNGQFVFVVVDPITGAVLAVDQATCAVVETVTP